MPYPKWLSWPSSKGPVTGSANSSPGRRIGGGNQFRASGHRTARRGIEAKLAIVLAVSGIDQQDLARPRPRLRVDPGPAVGHLVEPPHGHVTDQRVHPAHWDPAAPLRRGSLTIGRRPVVLCFRFPVGPDELDVQVLGVPDIRGDVDVGTAEVRRGVEQTDQVGPAQYGYLRLGDVHIAVQQVFTGDRTALEPRQFGTRRVNIRLLVWQRPGRRTTELGVFHCLYTSRAASTVLSTASVSVPASLDKGLAPQFAYVDFIAHLTWNSRRSSASRTEPRPRPTPPERW